MNFLERNIRPLKNQVDLHFPNGTISTGLKDERETMPPRLMKDGIHGVEK